MKIKSSKNICNFSTWIVKVIVNFNR